jgi:transcription antitermination factor NusG
MIKKWYVVFTKTNYEKKVAAGFAKNKIQHFLPLNCLSKTGVERKKLLLEPLFPNFVFVKLTEFEMEAAKRIRGVINYLYWIDTPAVIKDVEIDIINSFICEHPSVELVKSSVSKKEIIKITNQYHSGEMPNSGVVQIKSIILSLPSLGYNLIANVQQTKVELIKPPHADFRGDKLTA